jgi:hypothetical protein
MALESGMYEEMNILHTVFPNVLSSIPDGNKNAWIFTQHVYM